MKDKSPHRLYLVLALCFGLCLLGCALSFDIAFICKFVVQFVASGRSFFKTYFLFGWGMVCFLTLALFPSKAKSTFATPVFALVLLLMSLNLSSHVVFTKQFDLGWLDYSLTSIDRKFSSTRLIHTHTFKPPLMLGIEFLGVNPFQLNADAGYAYYILLPRWIYYLGGITFIPLFVLLLRGLIVLEKRWKEPLRIGFVILYVFSSFGVIRTIFDGGPLSPEAVVCLSVLFSLFTVKDEQPPRALLYFTRNLLIPLSALVPFYYLSHPFNFATLIRDCAISSVFCLALACTIYLFYSRSKASLSLFFISFTLLLGLASDHFWVNELSYLLEGYKKGDQIYFLNYTGQKVPFRKYLQEGHLSLHRISAPNDGILWQLFRDTRIPPSYSPFHIDGRTCSAKNPFTRDGRVHIIGERTRLTSTPSPLFTEFSLKACSANETCDYHYHAAIKGCIADSAEQLVTNHLYEMGAKRIILIPDIKHF